MAILGTFVDIQTVSRVGDDLTGLTVGTLFHSLPATTPEAVMLQLRSVQAVGLGGVNPMPLYVAGNQSMLSIGFNVPSNVSCPTVMYDRYAMVFHSQIR